MSGTTILKGTVMATNPTIEQMRAAWLSRTTVLYRGKKWNAELLVTGEYELTREVRVSNHRRNQRHRTVSVRFPGK